VKKEYKAVAFRAQISGKLSPDKIAKQFEEILNAGHKDGWKTNESLKDISIPPQSPDFTLSSRKSLHKTYEPSHEQTSSQIGVGPEIEDESKKIIKPLTTSQSKPWHKKKANMIYGGGILLAFAALFYYMQQNPKATIDSEERVENSEKIGLRLLIRDFKNAYKEGDYEKANDILIKIEEISPASNFATSARKVLDKKLTR